MLEKHPFGIFVPQNAKYLLLGSFTTKPYSGYEWFYANGRNQFWPIMEAVYGKSLKTKTDQQKLFVDLKMAITDIILECDRQNNSNLDINLKSLVFNTKAISEFLSKNKIKNIYFSSRFVEKLYRSKFKELIEKYPKIELITLPSPSPRYAQMTKAEKIKIYKKLLPSFKIS
jgi:hypoxanthine-DNA glycosylase